MTFSLMDAFLTIFIGMGPVKVLLIYIAKTQGMDSAIKRQIATRIVWSRAVWPLDSLSLARPCNRYSTSPSAP